MPQPEKTLRDTLGEVVRETPKETPQPIPNETEEGISDRQAGETESGDTPQPEYVSGIDISDVPEQDRPRFKELFSKKAKLLESGYQTKFQEVSQLKKAQDELTRMGLTVDEAQGVLTKHIEQKRNPIVTNVEKKEASRLLDKLLSEVPYEQKGSLEQLRQIILEETSVKDLQKKVSDLEQLVGSFNATVADTRRKELETDLNSLSDKYGKELIDKYRDVVISEGLKYKAPTRNLLHAIVSPDELEQALLVKRQVGKPLTQEKKQAISSPNSGIAGSKEQINTKKPWKDVISELVKK